MVTWVRVTNINDLRGQQGIPRPLEGGRCHLHLTHVAMREWGPGLSPPQIFKKKKEIFLNLNKCCQWYLKRVGETSDVSGCYSLGDELRNKKENFPRESCSFCSSSPSCSAGHIPVSTAGWLASYQLSASCDHLGSHSVTMSASLSLTLLHHHGILVGTAPHPQLCPGPLELGLTALWPTGPGLSRCFESSREARKADCVCNLCVLLCQLQFFKKKWFFFFKRWGPNHACLDWLCPWAPSCAFIQLPC